MFFKFIFWLKMVDFLFKIIEYDKIK